MIEKEKPQKDFWDDYVYDRRVKQDHELMKIKENVNLKRCLTPFLIKLYSAV